ncbi:MAG: hypothetical protein MUP21_01265 [Dehalococcoidia bacterium]|nr:hypothetical protein [Dehalococcoidia bacterium]
MEKYGVGGDAQLIALRDEEAKLMQKMSAFMSTPTRPSGQEDEYQQVQSRLQEVREKISEKDLKNQTDNG